MSEMKMSDVFDTDDFNIMHQAEIVDTSKYAYIEHNEIQIEGEAHINHAVLNHDRMLEEIVELRASEAELVNRNEDLLCIIDDLTRIARALDKPEKHTNSQHKRAKRDLCKLLAKLNQEGEE